MYVHNLTPKLISVFKNFNVRIAKKKDIKTVPQIFTNMERPVSLLEKSDILYEISHVNCNKVYIGQTSRILGMDVEKKINARRSF